MSENEKRRSALYEQMKNNTVPVIHPRYCATYNSLYHSDEKRGKKSNIFGIVVIVLFVGIGYYMYTEKPVIDTGVIIDRIEAEIERFVDFTILD